MSTTIQAVTGELIRVDLADLGAVIGHSWRINAKDDCRYAVFHRRVDGRITAVLMHRVILGAKKGQIVDHINGDGLDNRRENLRFVTHGQNMQNRRGATKRSKTGIRGVFFEVRKARYVAKVKVNRRVVHLSYHRTIAEAQAAAVNARAIHMTHSPENKRAV